MLCGKIRVRPVGIIRKYVAEQDMDLPEGLTPRQLIHDLAIPRKLKMVSFVNGVRTSLDATLKNGDEVILVTLLSGG
jgi:sulfur carrier protein ThiS